MVAVSTNLIIVHSVIHTLCLWPRTRTQRQSCFTIHLQLLLGPLITHTHIYMCMNTHTQRERCFTHPLHLYLCPLTTHTHIYICMNTHTHTHTQRHTHRHAHTQ